MLEALSSLLIVGGVWWCVITLAIGITLIALVENEMPWFSLGSIILYFAAIHFLGDANVLGWMVHHGLSTITMILSYLVFGAVWSYSKWRYFFLPGMLEAVKEANEEYRNAKVPSQVIRDRAQSRGFGVREEPEMVPASSQMTLQEWWSTRYQGKYYEQSIPPKVRANKKRLITWMAYWPWSAFWTLLHDYILQIWEKIYARLVKFYEAAVKTVFPDGMFNPPAN